MSGQWRIIYNDDGAEAQGASTVEVFLNRRLRPLQETQVDLVMFDPYLTELLPMFPTAGKNYLGNRDPDYLGNWREDGSGRIPILDNGGDPLLVAMDCCRWETREKYPPNSDSEFARSNTISGGIDFFVTFRVNDAQDVEEVTRFDNRPYNSVDYPHPSLPNLRDTQRFLRTFESWYEAGHFPHFSRWKLRHWECLLGGDYLYAVQNDLPLPYDPAQLPQSPEAEKSDPRYRWTTKNYARKLVRRRLTHAIQDVCNNYDIDGIELDFVKGPVHFPETFSPAPTRVSQAHTEIMTHLVSMIRRKTKAIAQLRGRPILIACRVPEHVSQARFIGLDVEAWLDRGLIDLMIAGSGHAPRNMMEPLTEMVALGNSYGIPVYGAIAAEIGALADEPPRGPNTDAWRGAASNIQNAGAGVYTFNFFPNPDEEDSMFPLLKQIGEQSTILSHRRIYGLDNVATDQDNNLSPTTILDALSSARVVRGNPYGATELTFEDSIPDVLPKVLAAQPNVFQLAVGEDLSATSPVTVLLSLRLFKPPKVDDYDTGDRIHITVNDTLITPSGGVHATFHGFCSVPCPPGVVIPGSNTVAVSVDTAGEFDEVPRVLVTLDLLVA